MKNVLKVLILTSFFAMSSCHKGSSAQGTGNENTNKVAMSGDDEDEPFVDCDNIIFTINKMRKSLYPATKEERGLSSVGEKAVIFDFQETGFDLLSIVDDGSIYTYGDGDIPEQNICLGKNAKVKLRQEEGESIGGLWEKKAVKEHATVLFLRSLSDVAGSICFTKKSDAEEFIKQLSTYGVYKYKEDDGDVLIIPKKKLKKGTPPVQATKEQWNDGCSFMDYFFETKIENDSDGWYSIGWCEPMW